MCAKWMVGLIALVHLAALVTVLLLLDAATLLLVLAVVNLALLLAFWKGCMRHLFQN